MAKIRRLSSVAGAIHDVARLQGLDPDVCHVLFVSEQTLSVLNNLSENEITYFARYATSFEPEGWFTPLDADDVQVGFVTDLVRRIKLELIPMTCDLTQTLENLSQAIAGLSGSVGAGCGSCPEEAIGSVEDPGTLGGTPGELPPPGYTDDPFDLNDKCLISNWYYAQTLNTIAALEDYNVVGWIGVGIASAMGTILALLGTVISGTFAALFTSQFGTLVSIIEALGELPASSLQNIVDAMDADQSGFVCALYTSSEVGNARENISDWAQPAGLTAAEEGVLLLVLNNYVLNGLFYYNQDSLDEAALGTGYYDCSLCGPVGDGIPLVLSEGTGTITYDGSEFTITSVDVGGFHQIQWTMTCSGDPYPDGGNWCLQFTGTTIDDTLTIYTRSIWGFTQACALNTKEYQTLSPSFPPLNTDLVAPVIQMANPTQFTITAKICSWVDYLQPGEGPDTHPFSPCGC